MKLNYRQKRITALGLLIIAVNYFLGCTYYKPINVNANSAQTKQSTLKDLNAKGKYFILRKGNTSYSMTNVVLDETKMTLSAKPDQIAIEQTAYVLHKERSAYTYNKSKGEAVVLTEVHIYT